MTSRPLTTIDNFTVVAQFCFSVDVIACIRLIVQPAKLSCPLKRSGVARILLNSFTVDKLFLASTVSDSELYVNVEKSLNSFCCLTFCSCVYGA